MTLLRASTDRYLVETVELWRAAVTDDGQGGLITGDYTLVDSGPGRTAPMGEGEEVFAERLGGSQGWFVDVLPDREVQLTDQLRAGGRTFEVISSDYAKRDGWKQRVAARLIT